MTEPETQRPLREPSVVDAVIPMVTLVVLIGGSLALFGLDALDGPIQAALIICSMVAALIALKNGHPGRTSNGSDRSRCPPSPARCSSCWRSGR